MWEGGKMSNLTKLGKAILLVLLIQISCTKLPQAPKGEGAFATVDIIQTNSIPAEWGKLVSATVSPDFPRRVQLWFQNEAGEIHLAFYEMPQRQLAPKAVMIPRS